MKILVVHNRYRIAGGEDSVVNSEIELLRSRRNEVIPFIRSNEEIKKNSIHLFREALWSSTTTKGIGQLLDEHSPNLVHVHNTFPLISPSVYHAVSQKNIPIVQTLHNFRLFCIGATFLRNGRICERCAGKSPWRGVASRCYRNSLPESFVAASVLATHRFLKTYINRIDSFIVLSEMSKSQFVSAGIPEKKIFLKPNFADSLCSINTEERKGGAFISRMVAEKGVIVVREAIEHVRDVHFDVVGEGPLSTVMKNVTQIVYHGVTNSETINAILTKARYLVVPSICYEQFPRVLVEAYACGTPVIASRLGSLKELVLEDRTGLLFNAGDPKSLAEKIKWAEAHPEEMAKMGRNARKEYELKYTPERNYEILMDIYRETIKRKHLQ